MAQYVATRQPATVVDDVPKQERRPSKTFLHSLAFVLGFTIVFVLLGSAAGLLGQSLNRYLPTIQRFGAVLLFIFALTTLGVFRWLVAFINQHFDTDTNLLATAAISILDFFNGMLYTERRVTEMHKVKRSWGYMSSTLMGMSFSAGWVPCVGPILAGILFVASDSATAATGAILLLFYSLGLGIPFLLTGAAFGRATKLLRSLNKHARVVSIISGMFLLYVAWLLWFDQLTVLTANFAFLNETIFGIEEAVTASLGISTEVSAIGASAISGAPIAFIAGLISFLSPCVLPLIPAYIGYLSGASLSEAE